MNTRPGVAAEPTIQAEAVPVDGLPMQTVANRPTFHLSRDTLCFLGGVAITLGILYLVKKISTNKGRD